MSDFLRSKLFVLYLVLSSVFSLWFINDRILFDELSSYDFPNIPRMIINSLIAGQLVGMATLGIGLLAGGLLAKTNKHATTAIVAIVATLLIYVPAYFIFRSNNYIRFGDGGPAGANFDCLMWVDWVQSYSNPHDHYCSLANTPTLNSYLLNSSDSYYGNAGIGYWTSVVVSQLILAAPLYMLSKNYKKPTSPHNNTAPNVVL